MFPGDEREIVHLQADWSIVLTALLWVWLSLTVTVLAVREQFRRQKAANLERAKDEWINVSSSDICGGSRDVHPSRHDSMGTED